MKKLILAFLGLCLYAVVITVAFFGLVGLGRLFYKDFIISNKEFKEECLKDPRWDRACPGIILWEFKKGNI